MESQDSVFLNVQSFMDNIPGILLCYEYGEEFTIYWASSSFYELIGYTPKEVEWIFHNRYDELVYEEDRARFADRREGTAGDGEARRTEYRILQKTGAPLWVLDKSRLIGTTGGRKAVGCVLTDISEEMRTQEELKLSLERYQIVMNQTNDIIFEWNIVEDRMSLSANWEKKFHFRPVTDRFSRRVTDDFHIHPDDIGTLHMILDEIKKGKDYLETELRIQGAGSRYIWCRLRLTTLFNKKREPVKAVGVIIDIDSEKKQSQRLLEKAQRDPLTKLYNKGTVRSIIEEQLRESGPGTVCALMIVDIDDFKIINDTMGHLCGDAFLMEIAREMKNLFRSEDVVGRVGGDEFVVFLHKIHDRDVARSKAGMLVDAFAEIPVQDAHKHLVSCSIGVALYPNNGSCFQELYENADMALYQAKKRGKNQYCMYDGEAMGKHFEGLEAKGRLAINEKIDSDQDMGESINNRLIEYVFRILYKSMDIESAISPILEIVGCQFDVNRVYIFENTEDNRYCRNTFEWCNKDTEPQMEKLQRVSYEEDLGGVYLENFNENGIFYCRDIRDLPAKQRAILEPQGIKSMLQCAIKDNGRFRGYVGFDECRVNRFWTEKQVVVLSFIAEILSTFLMKKRTQDRLVQSMASLETILDNQNSWIYVVDLETYEMYYVNKRTITLLGEARVGRRCYEVFFKRKEPCEICPAKGIGEHMKNQTLEVYNPVLDLWTSADASLISWCGKSACLLSCHDITQYKRHL